MKINRRITDNLTIELDLSGHALQMALQDGYSPQEQPEGETFVCEICEQPFSVARLRVTCQVFTDGEEVCYEHCDSKECTAAAYDKLGLDYYDGREWASGYHPEG